MNNPPKIALVADWLTNFAGAENVIVSFKNIFPQSPIFTTVFVEKEFSHIKQINNVYPSFLQKLPKFLRKNHRLLFPLLPKAIESFDFSDFDIVLSSSIFVSKNILTNPKTKHFCYCHCPARFLWDEKNYLKNFPLPKIIKFFLPYFFSKLRFWDFFSTNRVDKFIANSDFTAEKIKKFYKRDALVISPPVDWEKFQPALKEKKKDFFLWVGRLVAQKNLELLINTFKNLKQKKLYLIGQGNLEKKLKTMAKNNKNIKFLGFLKDEYLPQFYGQAKAVIFPQEEDAGIVPLESLSSGTPVIALKKGGVLTTLNSKVACFFEQETEQSLQEKIKEFENKKFSRKKLRQYAKKFSRENFEIKIKKVIDQ